MDYCKCEKLVAFIVNKDGRRCVDCGKEISVKQLQEDGKRSRRWKKR